MASRIQRTGAVVSRPAEFWSPAVHGLLRHLESAGFPAPRPLGINSGRELLTWIDGESGPAGWAKIVPESGLRGWAAFLRRYHDAVSGYHPAPAGPAGRARANLARSSATVISARGTASGTAITRWA
jgi:hypothetical protein